MVWKSQGAVVGQVRMLFEVGAVGSMTDGDLLDRFVHDRERGGDAAFEALVQRHGSMVFRVCRQSLADVHDAEDAFQATFLILARNARSIRDRESVSAWLFGVARKVSARSRSLKIQQRQREVASLEVSGGSAAKPNEFDDLLTEVERLPKTLRQSVVLYYWQGLTYDETAATLGVTEATIRGRLARARDLLRKRLSRDEASAEIIASMLAMPGCLEAMPLRLILPTVRASIHLGAGRSLVGVVTPSVMSLWKGASNAMLTANWIRGVAFLLTLSGTVGLGTAVLAVQKTARPSAARSAPRSQTGRAETGRGVDTRRQAG